MYRIYLFQFSIFIFSIFQFQFLGIFSQNISFHDDYDDSGGRKQRSCLNLTAGNVRAVVPRAQLRVTLIFQRIVHWDSLPIHCDCELRERRRALFHSTPEGPID